MSTMEERLNSISGRLMRRILDSTVFNPVIPIEWRKDTASLAVRATLAVVGPSKGRAPKDMKIVRHWRPAPDNELALGDMIATRQREPKGVDFYKEDLFDRVFFYMRRKVSFNAGGWDEHDGDAHNWGSLTLLEYARLTGSEPLGDMAQASLNHCRRLLTARINRPMLLVKGAEHSIMSALALMEAQRLTPELDDSRLISQVIAFFNGLFSIVGYVLELGAGAKLQDCFGTVTPAALVAMVNLLAADYFDRMGRPEEAKIHLDIAFEAVRAIDEKAWDPENNRYRFRPGEDREFAYPAPVMLMVLVMLYQRTRDAAYLGRAQTLLNSLDRLWDAELGGYFTPYWKLWVEGVYDHSTKELSAQYFVALASGRLYALDGDEAHLGRIRAVMDFIERDLYRDGVVWHDWDRQTGRSGVHSFEPYCVGCNLAVLYTLLYLNCTLGLGRELLGK